MITKRILIKIYEGNKIGRHLEHFEGRSMCDLLDGLNDKFIQN